MKPLFSTLMLMLAVSYQGQSCNCIRIALDARRENEPADFWLARARFMAGEKRDYLNRWRLWTAMAA